MMLLQPSQTACPRLHTMRMPLVCVLVMLAAAPAFGQGSSAIHPQQSITNRQGAHAIIGKQRFRLQVVQTPAAQKKGLAGRKQIAHNTGMLFVYDKKARYAFWMRGMLTSIDIIWLDNRRVVHIEHAVPPPKKGTPDDKLAVYKPPHLANLVLEIASGRAKQLGLHVGDTIGLQF